VCANYACNRKDTQCSTFYPVGLRAPFMFERQKNFQLLGLRFLTWWQQFCPLSGLMTRSFLSMQPPSMSPPPRVSEIPQN